VQFLTETPCILCGVHTSEDFCKPCHDHLPRLPAYYCPICLWPVPTGEICGACLKTPPAFTRTIAALRYDFPADALIQSLKYQNNLAIAPILANLLFAHLQTIAAKPDIIVPMPLHPIRLRERGFNQAMEIGRYLAQQMKIPLLPDCCSRIKHTPPQTGLPWKARQKNIRKAFGCTIDLSGKHVAVLDDVMTSGASLNELATVLRQQGAAEISNWVIARTLPELNQTTIHTM